MYVVFIGIPGLKFWKSVNVPTFPRSMVLNQKTFAKLVIFGVCNEALQALWEEVISKSSCIKSVHYITLKVTLLTQQLKDNKMHVWLYIAEGAKGVRTHD